MFSDVEENVDSGKADDNDNRAETVGDCADDFTVTLSGTVLEVLVETEERSVVNGCTGVVLVCY